jgi:hypothetical protein
MGCSQSALAVATLSQHEAPGPVAGTSAPGTPTLQHISRGSSLFQRSVKPPTVRTFPADPAKASESATVKQESMAAGEAMLLANQGQNYRDTYIRATLVSYGGSCRVFTAVHKHSQQPVAIKTITKVRNTNRPCCGSCRAAAAEWQQQVGSSRMVVNKR